MLGTTLSGAQAGNQSGALLLQDANSLTQLIATPLNSAAIANTAARSVAFIDSAIANYEILATGLSSDIAVYLLSGQQPGIEQITQVLAEYANLETLQVFAHGHDGTLQLGNQPLNQQSLAAHNRLVASWASALTEDADLLLYGCNFAATAVGQSLAQQLAYLSGADVAASSDLTGHQTLGGDWDLEYATGAIATVQGLSPTAQANFAQLLNSPPPSPPLSDYASSGHSIDGNKPEPKPESFTPDKPENGLGHSLGGHKPEPKITPDKPENGAGASIGDNHPGHQTPGGQSPNHPGNEHSGNNPPTNNPPTNNPPQPIGSDILLRHRHNSNAAIWHIEPTSFARTATFSHPYDVSWRLAGVGDLDNDGVSDHVYQKGDELRYLHFDVNGAIKHQNAPILNHEIFASLKGQAGTKVTGWELVGIANVVGDATVDLIFYSAGADRVAYWENNGQGQIIGGGNLTSQLAPEGQGTGGVGSGWRVKAVADFTGDHKADIFWHNQNSNELALWELDGVIVKRDKNSQTRVFDAKFNRSGDFQVVGIGDLDGSGPHDMVWRNQTTGETEFWRFAASGDPKIMTESFYSGSSQIEIVAVSDINGDDKSDVIWHNTASGNVGTWLLNLSEQAVMSLDDLIMPGSGWRESAPNQPWQIDPLDWQIEAMHDPQPA